MKVTVLALLMAVSPQTRATVNRAFRQGDFEVVWTASPSEAIEASARHRPDLLLLDLNEPLHQGWGTLDRLTTANPGAPVVVLAESESTYNEAIAKRKGVVLQKPVGEATLVDTVKTLLNVSSPGPAPEGARNARLDNGIAESERCRAMLLERYNTPYVFPTTHRNWGINE